jgi:hypothetical protein
MGLRETLQSAAITAIKAVGNVAFYVYYRKKGTVTYDPVLGRQTESNAVDQIEKVDISADATNSQFDSVATDFTTMGFSTAQYAKVSGFSTSGNNGFFLPTTIAASSLTISGLTLTDEAAGNDIVFDGPYYRFKAIETGFRSKEDPADSSDPMIDTDKKLLIPAKDFLNQSIYPDQNDFVWVNNQKWVVIRFDTDPSEALFILRIRYWEFYKR